VEDTLNIRCNWKSIFFFIEETLRLSTWLIVAASLITLKRVWLSRLKQHNFVSIVDIKAELGTVAYIYKANYCVKFCVVALSSF